MKPFWYVFIHHPKQGPDKLVGEEPKFFLVLANNEKEAYIKAAIKIPDGLRDNPEEVEICVRPF